MPDQLRHRVEFPVVEIWTMVSRVLGGSVAMSRAQIVSWLYPGTSKRSIPIDLELPSMDLVVKSSNREANCTLPERMSTGHLGLRTVTQ
jgi:hypothetical protein